MSIFFSGFFSDLCVYFRDYRSSVFSLLTYSKNPLYPSEYFGYISELCHFIRDFKNAAEQAAAYAYLADWEEARQEYEYRAKALVEAGRVSYFNGEVTMSYRWNVESVELVVDVSVDGAESSIALHTLKHISQEELEKIPIFFYVDKVFRDLKQNDPKVTFGNPYRFSLGTVYLDQSFTHTYIARHMTAKGEIVKTEIDPTDMGALDIFKSLQIAAEEEVSEFWAAVNANRMIGQTAVSVLSGGNGVCIATITTPDVGTEEMTVYSLKDIQVAVARHQMLARLPKLIGGTVVVEIPLAPADVSIQSLSGMSNGTDFATQINRLVEWIENRSPYVGVPGDPIEREQWYTKLETLIRLSMKHLIDHPDPGKQIVYLAGMADATNACGVAWMDQAYIQYVSLTAPDQFRRIQEPGPRIGSLLNDTKTIVVNRLINKYLILAQQEGQYSDPRHMRFYLLERIGRDVGLPVLDVVDTHAPGFMENVDVMQDFRDELMKFTIDELIDNVYRSMVESMNKGDVSRLFGPAIVKFIEDRIEEGHPEQIWIGGKPALSDEDVTKMRAAKDSLVPNPELDAYDLMTWVPAHCWKDGLITRDAVEFLLAQFGFIPPSDERPRLLNWAGE